VLANIIVDLLAAKPKQAAHDPQFHVVDLRTKTAGMALSRRAGAAEKIIRKVSNKIISVMAKENVRQRRRLATCAKNL